MATMTPPKSITAAEFLRMPDQDFFELVDGELVERPMSMLSCHVAGRLLARIQTFADTQNLGWAFPADTGYQCYPGRPNLVRRPDVSFIAASRYTLEQLNNEGWGTVAPDLAVEVLSPNDIAYEVDAKVREYLAAGVRLVWVINPDGRTVTIHRPQGPGTVLHEQDELAGETVLPGFRCRIADLFPPASTRPTP